MARPNYNAAKRQREMRKQVERQRKLARKHNRRKGGMAESQEDSAATETGREPEAPEASAPPADPA